MKSIVGLACLLALHAARAEVTEEVVSLPSAGDAKLPVVYTGILPDLFRENQAVIATGRMRGGVFVAEEVLAKHDETYMPKEVADKMAAAHKKHAVPASPAADAAAPSPTKGEGNN